MDTTTTNRPLYNETQDALVVAQPDGTYVVLCQRHKMDEACGDWGDVLAALEGLRAQEYRATGYDGQRAYYLPVACTGLTLMEADGDGWCDPRPTADRALAGDLEA